MAEEEDRVSVETTGGVPQFTKLRIIRNLVLISSSFLLVFTAYDGLSMLQSTMNKNMGTVSQAVVYSGFCISSLLFPKYAIKKFGCKVVLVTATMLFVPYIAANFYPHWATLMPAAVLSGIGASFIWASQCTYFNQCAMFYCLITSKEEAPKRNQSIETSSKQTSVEALSTTSNGTSDETIPKSVSIKKEETSISASNNASVEELSVANIATKYKDFYETSTETVGSPEIKSKYSGNTSKDVADNSAEHQVRRNSYFIIKRFKVRLLSSGEVKNKPSDPPDKTDDELNSFAEVSYNPNHGGSLSRMRNSISSKYAAEYCNNYVRKSTGFIDAIQRFAGLESVNARFFGCHGIAFHSAQVLSNLVSYFVLRRDTPSTPSNTTFNVNITNNSSCACGAAFCGTPCGGGGGSSNDISDDMRNILTGISVVLAVLGVILVWIFLDKLGTEKEPVSFNTRALLATFNHCKRRDQLFLLPISLYIGMVQGFYTADFTKSYISCAWGTAHVGLVTIYYGLACAISAPLSGWLVKYTGRMPILLFCQTVNILTNILLLMWKPNPEQEYMFHVAAGLWGIVTGILWAQLPALYGVMFKNNEEAAFGAYYLFNSLGWCISFFISDFICTSIKIYILLAVSSLGILGYLVTERIYSDAKIKLSRSFAS